MPRLIFSDAEYQELIRFANERGINPKEALLAFVRLGNRASDKGRTTLRPTPTLDQTESKLLPEEGLPPN